MKDAQAESQAELASLRDRFATVDGVPVVAELPKVGSLGIAGARDGVLSTARALVAQLVCLHSPAEVIVCAVTSSNAAADWEWLKWLPHDLEEHSPLAADHLAATSGSAVRLVAALEELVDRRQEQARDAKSPPLPAVVVVVEDDAPVERSRLVELTELGREVSVHVVWLAPVSTHLPGACRAFIEVDDVDRGVGAVGFVEDGVRVEKVTLEQSEAITVDLLARSLAPVIDAGARTEDDSDLPRTVSLLSLIGVDAASSSDTIVERWRLSGSLPGVDTGSRKTKERDLQSTVGMASGQPFVLDLREHGPHALVGGTTGAGKSEFLQSWVMSIAADHSPSQVTFLFVDYKGGSAFIEAFEASALGKGWLPT